MSALRPHPIARLPRCPGRCGHQMSHANSLMQLTALLRMGQWLHAVSAMLAPGCANSMRMGYSKNSAVLRARPITPRLHMLRCRRGTRDPCYI